MARRARAGGALVGDERGDVGQVCGEEGDEPGEEAAGLEQHVAERRDDEPDRHQAGQGPCRCAAGPSRRGRAPAAVSPGAAARQIELPPHEEVEAQPRIPNPGQDRGRAPATMTPAARPPRSEVDHGGSIARCGRSFRSTQLVRVREARPLASAGGRGSARSGEDDARAAGAGGRRAGDPAAAAARRGRALDRAADRRRAGLDARRRGRLARPLRAPLLDRHAAPGRHRRHADRAAAAGSAARGFRDDRARRVPRAQPARRPRRSRSRARRGARAPTCGSS